MKGVEIVSSLEANEYPKYELWVKGVVIVSSLQVNEFPYPVEGPEMILYGWQGVKIRELISYPVEMMFILREIRFRCFTLSFL